MPDRGQQRQPSRRTPAPRWPRRERSNAPEGGGSFADSTIGSSSQVGIGLSSRVLLLPELASSQRTIVRSSAYTPLPGDTMTTSSTRRLTRLALIPCVAVGMVLVALSSPSQAQKVRPDFFGMHESQISSGSIPTVQLGAVRLWDTGTAWRQIETSPGVFDWSTVYAAVNTARAAGLKPMLVLGQTPQFHATKRKAPGAYGPGASSMPRQTAWKRYVSEAAKRFGTTVDYQIWNEPNVINYWTGSVSQMAQLTATASKTISRATKGKATVVAPAFPLRLKAQQKWFKKYWATKVSGKAMASYVDVVSLNLYPLASQGPEASMKLLALAQRTLPKAARKKPVWNTEINFGLLGGATAKTVPDAKQAAFVSRTLLLNAASPIRRAYWYSWAQGPIANTHLVQDDRTTLTRGGRAWQLTAGWITGTNMKKCAAEAKGKSKGLYTCTARVSRTEVRRFFWKPSGRAVNVKTPGSTTSWSDLDGHVTARTGRFNIKVGQSPIMVTSRS